MPVMSGDEASQQIWAEFGRDAVRIVAVSASTLTHQQDAYLKQGFDAFISKPFRARQIYDCLAELLHVEYQYEDHASPAIDFRGIILPPGLLERLRAAAELYQTTEFETLLSDVRQIGPEAERLAERLHQLSRDLEIEAILEVLGEVGHE